ncbi:gustatory receptor for sugar taste 64f-like [Anabrus simplex]|uniref:gustatory receptor for sugar taste 64f-like n=1 Tax=Anabrus simplex TaxID=316456 RepID=UPI0035A31630
MEPSSQLQWNIQPQTRRKRGTTLLVRVAPKPKEQKDIYCEFKITVTPEHLSYSSDGSFHSAIRSVLVAAQCFSLMPVHGITSDNTADLRFCWHSLRSLYTYCTVSLALLTTVIYCLQLTQTGLTFNNSCKFLAF